MYSTKEHSEEGGVYTYIEIYLIKSVETEESFSKEIIMDLLQKTKIHAKGLAWK